MTAPDQVLGAIAIIAVLFGLAIWAALKFTSNGDDQ